MVSISDESDGTTAVILLHGMTSTPAEMLNLIEPLTSLGIKPILPLLPGHDTSIAELKLIKLEQWQKCAEEAYQEAVKLRANKIFIIGLSFGALLALYLAEHHKEKISGLVLLSPIIKLRSKPNDLLLTLFSYLPDFLLNILPVANKLKRPDAHFSFPRKAYSQHSIGASARMMKLRREVLAATADIRCKCLILSDPEDHLIAHDSGNLLAKRLVSAPVTTKTFLGGLHELNIGPAATDVTSDIIEFICGTTL